MTLNRRAFMNSAALAAIATLLPVGGNALAMAVGQVAHRILAADKLSFLTEKVAKAVVLLSLGAEVEKDLKELQYAHDEFDNILLGFKEGKGTSGVDRERFVSVNNALKEVEALWAPYRIAIEEIIEAGSVDDEHLHLIVDNDEVLEKACHEVVRKLEEAYGDVDIDIALALALDFAGRQRMYTQKICKEIALAATGKETAEHHEKFKKNAKKFGKIIDVLIEGGSSSITMAKPPSNAALKALTEVQTHWAKMQPVVEKLDSQEVPNIDDVSHFCAEMDVLEIESEKAALLYEEAIKLDS
ncbi:type IV pili methyl-accepting chemotaxis transducer N-terminal domain-containing protein [uncultured Ruegeria sp.]|uniref:type IV pili methyl-accepting chemotaxis transducer N-terminal domain-containing protein n=1 Tax=uncultured Ruegeria sp. TaxID=259304 RepID=UPI00261427C9|nr:type IV pili methyl-accepting chemotaxis transducer N-terminal domain-containing protein [uncultured Ruegeria sp.]